MWPSCSGWSRAGCCWRGRTARPGRGRPCCGRGGRRWRCCSMSCSAGCWPAAAPRRGWPGGGAALGPLAPLAVAPMALLSGMVTGSNVGSNAALMPVQVALGAAAGLPPLLAPAIQNFAGAARVAGQPRRHRAGLRAAGGWHAAGAALAAAAALDAGGARPRLGRDAAVAALAALATPRPTSGRKRPMHTRRAALGAAAALLATPALVPARRRCFPDRPLRLDHRLPAGRRHRHRRPHPRRAAGPAPGPAGDRREPRRRRRQYRRPGGQRGGARRLHPADRHRRDVRGEPAALRQVGRRPAAGLPAARYHQRHGQRALGRTRSGSMSARWPSWWRGASRAG